MQANFSRKVYSRGTDLLLIRFAINMGIEKAIFNIVYYNNSLKKVYHSF